MADYNVQMRQYNGSEFDNVYPDAYHAKNADNATSANTALTANSLAGGGVCV